MYKFDINVYQFFMLLLSQYAFQNDNYIFYVFEFAAGGMLFYHLVSLVPSCVIALPVKGRV